MNAVATTLLLCSAVAAFRISSSRVPNAGGQLQMLAIGEAAPDFQLKNAAGKAFKLSSFKGKKVANISAHSIL